MLDLELPFFEASKEKKDEMKNPLRRQNQLEYKISVKTFDAFKNEKNDNLRMLSHKTDGKKIIFLFVSSKVTSQYTIPNIHDCQPT
mgnify:CR=1 FL=1